MKLRAWQGRPTLKIPHQLTNNPLADSEDTLKVGRCQAVVEQNIFDNADDVYQNQNQDENIYKSINFFLFLHQFYSMTNEGSIFVYFWISARIYLFKDFLFVKITCSFFNRSSPNWKP